MPIQYNGICNLLDNYDPCSRITELDILEIGMLQYDKTLAMIDHLEEDCSIICEDKK